jgi:nucleoid DNA-binding protein
MERVKKSQIDAQVAVLLGKKRSEVSGITATFLREVVRGLSEKGEVNMDGLGRLKVICRRGTRQTTYTRIGHKKSKPARVHVPEKYYVSFKKAEPLTVAIKEARTGGHHGQVRSG